MTPSGEFHDTFCQSESAETGATIIKKDSKNAIYTECILPSVHRARRRLSGFAGEGVLGGAIHHGVGIASGLGDRRLSRFIGQKLSQGPKRPDPNRIRRAAGAFPKGRFGAYQLNEF